jgi:hypothetical protein
MTHFKFNVGDKIKWLKDGVTTGTVTETWMNGDIEYVAYINQNDHEICGPVSEYELL